MATSYDSIQRQANKGNDAQSTISQWVKDGLNAAHVRIQNNDNEDIQLTKNGLLCRTYDDVTETWSPEQLKITHNIMAYTDDNWKSVTQAIGKHDYKRYDETNKKFINSVGYGMTAEFVTAGYVSGSQIIGGDIYSDNYNGTTGSHLNLRDGTFDFAGGKLSYKENTLSVEGDIKSINGNIGCWYINGTSIYKGSSAWGNSSGMYFGDDGLSISNKFKVDKNGKLTCTSGTIGNCSIDENGNLQIGSSSLPDNIATKTYVTTITNNAISTAYISADQITSGQLDVGDVELFGDGGGGLCCAYGDDGTSTRTYGVKMYGSDGKNSSYYVIATNAGVRMQGGNQSFYVANDRIHASMPIDDGSKGSDKRLKNSIDYSMDKYEGFFYDLKPCFFRYNNWENNHYNIGFIAQDVENALIDNDLRTSDLAALGVTSRKNENDEYQDYLALDKEQFIALNTHMIQKLSHRIEELEEKLKNLEVGMK